MSSCTGFTRTPERLSTESQEMQVTLDTKTGVGETPARTHLSLPMLQGVQVR